MPRASIPPKASFYTHRPVVAHKVTISADGCHIKTTQNFVRVNPSVPLENDDASAFETIPMDLDPPENQPDVSNCTKETVDGLPSVQVVAKTRAKQYENSVGISNAYEL